MNDVPGKMVVTIVRADNSDSRAIICSDLQRRTSATARTKRPPHFGLTRLVHLDGVVRSRRPLERASTLIPVLGTSSVEDQPPGRIRDDERETVGLRMGRELCGAGPSDIDDHVQGIARASDHIASVVKHDEAASRSALHVNEVQFRLVEREAIIEHGRGAIGADELCEPGLHRVRKRPQFGDPVAVVDLRQQRQHVENVSEYLAVIRGGQFVVTTISKDLTIELSQHAGDRLLEQTGVAEEGGCTDHRLEVFDEVVAANVGLEVCSEISSVPTNLLMERSRVGPAVDHETVKTAQSPKPQ